MKIDTKILFKFIGLITFFGGIGMIPCFLCAIYFKEFESIHVFGILSIMLVSIGLILFNFLRSHKKKFHINDGFFIATICWLYCTLIGTLPFVLSGYNFMPSFFESVAGFTTTRCSVIQNELLTKSLTLWSALLNWAGGMGILVLVGSIFPSLGVSGQALASAETTGPALQKIGGRFSDTGQFLYICYFAFTLCEFILLATMSPLGVFDSLVNSFSTISTSGIYIRPDNELAFSSTYVRIVIMIFTILSSSNYILFYLWINGKRIEVLKNPELRVFCSLIVISSLAIAISLKISGTYSSFGLALKDSSFQVVSFISTSGYFVCDYNLWPTFGIVLLFSLLFVGGCSMSTSGSLKVIRIITLAKLIKRGVFSQIHPHSKKAIVIGGKAMPAKIVSAITSHIILYLVVLLSGFLLLSFDNLPLDTTITTALGVFTNTGVVLGEQGITGYLGMYGTFSQIVMCILMIAGRLEIYSLLLLFSRSFWSEDSGTRI